MNHTRAMKYRRLALGEPDKEKADLLYQIADEADRGVLFTAEWLSASNNTPEPVEAQAK